MSFALFLTHPKGKFFFFRVLFLIFCVPLLSCCTSPPAPVSFSQAFPEDLCKGVVSIYVLFPPKASPQKSPAASFSKPPFQGQHPVRFPLHSSSLAVGSGIVVSTKGHVLTAAHLLGENPEVYVQGPCQEMARASVIWTDNAYDLALLKAETSKVSDLFESPLPWASSLPALGETVWSASNLNGLSHSVSKGVVAFGRRKLSIYPVPVLQTNLLSAPGSSGGALINQKGELVGMIIGLSSLTPGPSPITLGVPVDVLRHKLQGVHGKGF